MVKFHQPDGTKLVLEKGLRKGEKNKLIAMSALTVVLLATFVFTFRSAKSYEARAVQDLPAQAPEIPEEKPYRPTIDRAALEQLVRDAAGPDRAEIEAEAVELLMRSARQMTAAAFDDADVAAIELDAARVAELIADPAAKRGEPCFARGWIEALETRRAGPASAERHLGRVQLEDGARVAFLVDQLPESTIDGDFVRVNGLFLKVHAQRDAQGEWIEAPLLVGRELLRSYARFALEGDAREQIDHVLSYVTDDDTESGITKLDHDTQWDLLSIVHGMPADAIDWAAAPELDRPTMLQLMADGEPFRGQPFRMPISILMGISVKRAGENPARLGYVTETWIGNTAWPVAAFCVAPAEYRDLRERDRVLARGIFYKNFAFTPRDGGIAVAPAFVLAGLERYTPPSDAPLRFAGYAIAGIGFVLLIALTFLLRRDEKASRKLHDRMVARRRARRGATTT